MERFEFLMERFADGHGAFCLPHGAFSRPAWSACPSGRRAPHVKKFGPMPLGPLRPLRGSGFALGQPDAYGTG